MKLLIALPILISFALFGLLWFKLKKKNPLSLILVGIAILIPLLPLIDYNETPLLLSIGMIVGWAVSLIGSKEIKEQELPRILKFILSGAFLLAAISFIISGPIAEVVLWNNYYQDLIVQISIFASFIGIVLFSILKIKKIRSVHNKK